MADEVGSANLFNANATVTTKINTESQSGVEVKFGQTFVRINDTAKETLVNNTADEITIVSGTLLGRVNSTMKVTFFDASAVDGSQYPVGAVAKDFTLGAGEEVGIVMVYDGAIPDDNLVTAQEDDTMSTIIDGISLKDRLKINCHLKVVGMTDNTASAVNWPNG